PRLATTRTLQPMLILPQLPQGSAYPLTLATYMCSRRYPGAAGQVWRQSERLVHLRLSLTGRTRWESLGMRWGITSGFTTRMHSNPPARRWNTAILWTLWDRLNRHIMVRSRRNVLAGWATARPRRSRRSRRAGIMCWIRTNRQVPTP